MTTEQIIKMQYIGLLNFVAEHSVYWSHPEGAEARDTFVRILEDAQAVLPGLEWRRILDRFELEFVDDS